uniref:Uncharacterized protein n=1 Tax=Kalanchoe fedtschenkoi TaxID=63787 RepID=A0A7N0US60_KALFE
MREVEIPKLRGRGEETEAGASPEKKYVDGIGSYDEAMCKQRTSTGFLRGAPRTPELARSAAARHSERQQLLQ